MSTRSARTTRVLSSRITWTIRASALEPVRPAHSARSPGATSARLRKPALGFRHDLLGDDDDVAALERARALDDQRREVVAGPDLRQSLNAARAPRSRRGLELAPCGRGQQVHRDRARGSGPRGRRSRVRACAPPPRIAAATPRRSGDRKVAGRAQIQRVGPLPAPRRVRRRRGRPGCAVWVSSRLQAAGVDERQIGAEEQRGVRASMRNLMRPADACGVLPAGRLLDDDTRHPASARARRLPPIHRLRGSVRRLRGVDARGQQSSWRGPPLLRAASTARAGSSRC